MAGILYIVATPIGNLEDMPPRVAATFGAADFIAAEEAEMAAKAGAKTVGLGPRILRCETAPLAVLSAVMTLTGNLE